MFVLCYRRVWSSSSERPIRCYPLLSDVTYRQNVKTRTCTSKVITSGIHSTKKWKSSAVDAERSRSNNTQGYQAVFHFYTSRRFGGEDWAFMFSWRCFLCRGADKVRLLIFVSPLTVAQATKWRISENPLDAIDIGVELEGGTRVVSRRNFW